MGWLFERVGTVITVFTAIMSHRKTIVMLEKIKLPPPKKKGIGVMLCQDNVWKQLNNM